MLVDFKFNPGVQSAVAFDTPLLIDVPADAVAGTELPDSDAIATPTVVETPTTTVADIATPTVVETPQTTVAVTPTLEPLTPSTEPSVTVADVPDITPTTTVTPTVETPTPTVAVTPTVVEPDPVEVATAVQSELKRIGCYTSSVDGDWGRGSERALERYYNAKDMSYANLQPTAALRDKLVAETGTICERPVVRPTTTTAGNGGTSTPRPTTQPADEPATTTTVKPNFGIGSGGFR